MKVHFFTYLQCKARCPRCTHAAHKLQTNTHTQTHTHTDTHTHTHTDTHTHTQAAHTPHKVENLQQVQQIHQIQETQKFQGILPRNLRRFQKCTTGQDCTHAAQCTERDLAGPAGPQFQKFQRSPKISQRQIQTERILRNKTPSLLEVETPSYGLRE